MFLQIVFEPKEIISNVNKYESRSMPKKSYTELLTKLTSITSYNKTRISSSWQQSKKKPALAGNSSGLQVAKIHHWLESQSFGWMKVTYASQKGYIVMSQSLKKLTSPPFWWMWVSPKVRSKASSWRSCLKKQPRQGKPKKKLWSTRIPFCSYELETARFCELETAKILWAWKSYQ